MPAPSKIADLANQYDDDRVLKRYLTRTLPDDVHGKIEPQLRSLGAITGGELYDLQMSERDARPELTQWDASGTRIDHVELTDVWKRAREVAAEYGVVATAYEQRYGAQSRVCQSALAYLFAPASEMMGFMLATTDGAARTLLQSGNRRLVDAAVSSLTSRSPDRFWTAGQWRTEQGGGTDLTNIQTTATPTDGDAWTLSGRKWFTSSSTANLALVLALPDDAEPVRQNLTLFYLPIRDLDDAPRQGIRVNRLKEAMGARHLPVAEIELDDATAYPVDGIGRGTQLLRPMVERTRLWNALLSIGAMRRGLALARDYARNREAFGTPIIEKPLHYDTMASMQATFEGAFHLTFRLAELIGRHEADDASEHTSNLLRALTPIVKLTTARQAVEVTGEVMEAFGGAGFVEDSGIPTLLRDVYALPVWEGTTNVMSLVTIQTLRRDGRLRALKDELQRCADAVEDPALEHAVRTSREAFRNAVKWLAESVEKGPDAVEAGARRFALTLGNALELALLARHAQWAVHREGRRASAVVEHFATQPIDLIAPRRHYDAYVLAQDLSTQSLFNFET